MEPDDFDQAENTEAECPHCGADVGYDEWIGPNNDGDLVCPYCWTPCDFDDLYMDL